MTVEGQASVCTGSEHFPSLKCVCQASFFIFFLFLCCFVFWLFACLLACFIFSPGAEVEIERRGKDRCCSAGRPLVCHLDHCLSRTRPGHTPDVPSWFSVLEGLPAWPVMTLTPFFTLWLRVSLDIARVSYSICRRLRLKVPKAQLGLWADEKAGPRCEPAAHLQLCWNCAHSSSAWTSANPIHSTMFTSLPATTLQVHTAACPGSPDLWLFLLCKRT